MAFIGLINGGDPITPYVRPGSPSCKQNPRKTPKEIDGLFRDRNTPPARPAITSCGGVALGVPLNSHDDSYGSTFSGMNLLGSIVDSDSSYLQYFS